MKVPKLGTSHLVTSEDFVGFCPALNGQGAVVLTHEHWREQVGGIRPSDLLLASSNENPHRAMVLQVIDGPAAGLPSITAPEPSEYQPVQTQILGVVTFERSAPVFTTEIQNLPHEFFMNVHKLRDPGKAMIEALLREAHARCIPT